jgi:hypothetical protein
MCRISSILLCAVALSAETPQELASFTGEIGSSLTVRISSAIEPPLKQSQVLLLWTGIADDHDRIHRSMQDKSTKAIIGYDLVAEPAGAPNRFLVRIEPLTKQQVRGTLAPLPKYPPPQLVEEGDTIALDLLVSPDGRQKLVDYIQVGRRVEPWPVKSVIPARDFTLDDGPLALQFVSPTRFYMGGQPFQGGVGFTGKPGGTIWFAVPGRGRYILSLAPHEGFQRGGAIRDNVLTFDDCEYRASAPILGAGKAWNLYVFHDLGYPSKWTPEPTVFGGVDRLENILAGR